MYLFIGNALYAQRRQRVPGKSRDYLKDNGIVILYIFGIVFIRIIWIWNPEKSLCASAGTDFFQQK